VTTPRVLRAAHRGTSRLPAPPGAVPSRTARGTRRQHPVRPSRAVPRVVRPKHHPKTRDRAMM
jgi:hypothetical protein